MTDLFPSIGLGESPDPNPKILSFKAETAVTKGQVVIANTHTVGEPVSVSPAGADAANVIGVAMEDIAAGARGMILVDGVIKVTASGAITAGNKVKSGAAGVVVAAITTIPSGAVTVTSDSAQPTIEGGIAFGIALQTFADGDTGLILVK